MNFNKYLLAIASVATSVFIFSGCTVKQERIIEKQAPQDMRESFSPASVSTENQCDKKSCITLKKSSLGKIFLLIASGKTSGATPQWYDLKPLVVSFEKSGNKLALLGENYNSIYEEIRTVNLIQTFDVVSEDDQSVTFDWGQGLKSFILQGSYDVDSPRGQNNDLTESSFKSLPVMDSFVRNIRFDDKNVELEQISKVRVDAVKSEQGGDLNLEPREETLAMNIQIRSYNLSSDFKKKEYDSSRRVGFFVTKVSKKGYSQEITNLITKWDLSASKGPIVVRISSAVPIEYVEAVKEGAFYWNKVFGQNIITVKTGVDPQSGPEDRSIFVRWIPWLDSGAAYAVGQSDPLTGEVLRAQVFMPSVFTRVGSADLVSLNGDSPVAGNAIACDFSKKFKALNDLAQEASDSQRLRLAQDSVRATVAHELGHALGLRHNFAGSFSAKVSADQVYAAAKTYLKDPQHQGLETSTSIMDYVGGIDDALMAAKIKYAPLSYDKMAMDWAYADNDAALDEKVSLYCTDDDIALAKSQGLQVYGCERFDAGNNPFLRKVLEAKSEKENFTRTLFASILGRLLPGDQPNVKRNLDAVLADTVKWGRLNLDTLEFAGQVLMDTSKGGVPAPSFASIFNVKAGLVMYSKFGVDEAFGKQRALSLAEAGGYGAVLNQLWKNQDGSLSKAWLAQQIEDLKSSPYLAKGKTLSGREYELSQEEQQKILKFFVSLTSANESSLNKGLEALLPVLDEVQQNPNTGATSIVSALIPKGLITDADASILYSLFFDLLQANKGTLIIKVGEGLSKEVSVAIPRFSLDEMLPWMKLLSSKGLRFDMDLKKALVRSQQAEKINTVLRNIDPGADITMIKKPGELGNALLKEGKMDAVGAQWLNYQVGILTSLEKTN